GKNVSMSAAGDLVDNLTDRLAPLDRELGLAWWDASTHASAEADERRAAADLARREFLADGDAYGEVRAQLDTSRGADGHTIRALELLGDAMIPHQVPADLLRAQVDLETSVDARFTAHRADLDGDRVDDNALLEILRTSNDSGERRAAWEAGKQIGAE